MISMVSAREVGRPTASGTITRPDESRENASRTSRSSVTPGELFRAEDLRATLVGVSGRHGSNACATDRERDTSSDFSNPDDKSAMASDLAHEAARTSQRPLADDHFVVDLKLHRVDHG